MDTNFFAAAYNGGMQKTLSVVDLNAIRRNAMNIRARLGEKFFYAVVKADGYGHGAVRVAHAVGEIVDGFCVAIVDEGAALRAAGVSKPILVLTPPLDGEDAARAAFYGLNVTVNSVQTARLIGGARCHIKVNTGMNRLGCTVGELPTLLRELEPSQIDGVYSHLYAAENGRASAEQLRLFGRAEELVKGINPHACAHLSASGGLLRGGNYVKDGVRCGILLYGYAPTGFSRVGFEPALKVYARRTQQTKFIGGGVGYNVAEREYDGLCTYRLGYADGFRRTVPLGEKTLCMDGFVREGGEEWLCVMDDADEYARRCGTISYEVLTSVTRRSEIRYL